MTVKFGSERADLAPKLADLAPEQADLAPERADLAPERADLDIKRLTWGQAQALGSGSGPSLWL